MLLQPGLDFFIGQNGQLANKDCIYVLERGKFVEFGTQEVQVKITGIVLSIILSTRDQKF
jgi:hypothetical protein